MTQSTTQSRKAFVEDLARKSEPFCEASVCAASYQLVTTFGLYMATTALIFQLVQQYGAWGFLLSPIGGGLVVRMFIFQHDCGHESFLPSARANDFVGLAMSIITGTPYEVWKREHAKHHAGSGNLNRRGVGDIDVLTVHEYLELPPLRQWWYRVMRNPLFLFFFFFPFYFIVLNRVPWGRGIPARQAARSIFGLDAVLAVVYGTLWYLFGWTLVLVLFLNLYIAMVIGVFLFYVQHQFEHTVWEPKETWDFKVAAVDGSSYLSLPPVGEWFTGSIGRHTLHHLKSRIPNYRLRTCYKACPEWEDINRLTLAEALKTIRYKLWDEEKQVMVGFP